MINENTMKTEETTNIQDVAGNEGVVLPKPQFGLSITSTNGQENVSVVKTFFEQQWEQKSTHGGRFVYIPRAIIRAFIKYVQHFFSNKHDTKKGYLVVGCKNDSYFCMFVVPTQFIAFEFNMKLDGFNILREHEKLGGNVLDTLLTLSIESLDGIASLSKGNNIKGFVFDLEKACIYPQPTWTQDGNVTIDANGSIPFTRSNFDASGAVGYLISELNPCKENMVTIDWEVVTGFLKGFDLIFDSLGDKSIDVNLGSHNRVKLNLWHPYGVDDGTSGNCLAIQYNSVGFRAEGIMLGCKHGI